MILRRVTEHVKTQDRAAVAREFVIVVDPIIVGLQAIEGKKGALAENRAGTPEGSGPCGVTRGTS